MLENYTPIIPAPKKCSDHYREGWIYADWWLRGGGSRNADSPDGWHEEKYEGWWDRLETKGTQGQDRSGTC